MLAMHRLLLRRQPASLCTAWFAAFQIPSATSFSSQTEPSTRGLPVGIFVDLDNVAPEKHGRLDAEEFVKPLRSFAENLGTLSAFQGFGNKATRTYVSEDEKERREDSAPVFNAEEFHTGYDKDGLLRCGICGARMKLSKKDRAKGLTEEKKLDKHMRMLHDREQAKRLNKGNHRKKNRKLNSKEKAKLEKYKAAQVDVFRSSNKWTKNNKQQLFAVLKEQGVRCQATEDVDKALIKAAKKWMKQLKPINDSETTDGITGCLVVYSRDADFCDLLEAGRSKNMLVVTATYKDEQTRKLKDASDLVLSSGGKDPPEAYSWKGVKFLRDHYDEQPENVDGDTEDVDLEEEELDVDLEEEELDVDLEEEELGAAWWEPKNNID